MENLETIKLSKQQELARYRRRTDAKPYVVNKLREQIAALENCVDLNDSKVDNQLLILLRDTLYKALYVENRADVLIVGMRLTNHPEIERVDLADLVYSTKLDDPQTGLYELLEIGRCIRSDKAVARLTFRHILEGLDNFKVYLIMGFVDDVIMGEPGSSKIDISALVIDLSEQLPDPQPIVRIWGNLIASRGNVSTVVGLAKSRKTFLTAAVASGFLSSSDFLGFDTPATGKVVYIDTEQARAHVHKVARRILRSIGLPTDHNHDKLVVAALRELTPDQRREATGEILRRYKPDLLILDGVADLCNDPNDLHESEALTCELMRWSSEYDNHILCVLHSNPGGEKARGHLGSALLRKSETVMLVKADGDTSVVSPQYCRNEPFTEFAFQINASGLPELCGIPAPQPKENVFAEIMEAGKVYAHSELIEMLMEAVDLKEGSAKSKISRAVKAGTIVKNQAGGYYLPGSQTEVSQPELHDEPF